MCVTVMYVFAHDVCVCLPLGKYHYAWALSAFVSVSVSVQRLETKDKPLALIVLFSLTNPDSPPVCLQ